jgi:hypothetical protein
MRQQPWLNLIECISFLLAILRDGTKALKVIDNPAYPITLLVSKCTVIGNDLVDHSPENSLDQRLVHAIACGEACVFFSLGILAIRINCGDGAGRFDLADFIGDNKAPAQQGDQLFIYFIDPHSQGINSVAHAFRSPMIEQFAGVQTTPDHFLVVRTTLA